MTIEKQSGNTDTNARMTGLILAAGLAFVLSLAGSALKSTVQVHFSDIADSLSVGISAFAWSTTLFAIGIAVASPVVGFLADRFGGAMVLVGGTALAGVTFLACAAAPSTFVFAPVYGIFGSVAFTMLSYVPLGKLADELFAGRGEGLAYSVMTNGPAVGFMVLVPLWVWLGTFLSWQSVFAFAGIVMLVVLTPLALYLRRATILGDDAASVAPLPTTTFVQRIAPLFTNARYVLLAIAFGGCGVTMAFVDVHMVSDMHMAGVHPTAASASVFLLGFFEITGALIAGRFCDRGYIKQTLIIGYGLRGAAMMVFAFTPTAMSSLVFGTIFGASYMATVVATTLWIMRLLPSGSRATAMGLVWTVHSIGAASSSQLGAIIAEKSGSYTVVSLVEALIVFGSLALVAFISVPRTVPGNGATSDASNRNLST
nr:MFS transporter [Mycobacterium sp.]